MPHRFFHFGFANSKTLEGNSADFCNRSLLTRMTRARAANPIQLPSDARYDFGQVSGIGQRRVCSKPFFCSLNVCRISLFQKQSQPGLPASASILWTNPSVLLDSTSNSRVIDIFSFPRSNPSSIGVENSRSAAA